MQGSGLEVVEVKNYSYQLNTDELKRILLRDDVKELPVVVVSVAGAYRGGKSFLLNFFLRYTTAPHSSRLDGSWLGEEDAPLEGFSWRGGSERNTTGIVIWSEPIITNLHTGEKVAVILMDTQGTFDSSSTVRDCSTIFALSTLLSSVQIYNLSQRIREDELQHLQFFTEYGKLVQDEGSKAFQVLEILVRDWPNAAEHSYGSNGGNTYLDVIFQINPTTKKELKDLREHIRSSFEQVSCFLMPHPGLEVIKPNFKGQNKDISPEFKTYMKEFASHIFGLDRLKIKEIGGQKLTASDLYTCFETYVNLFNSDDIPTPTSIMQATAEAGLRSAFEESRRLYENKMEKECGASQPSLPAHDLHYLHQTCVDTAVAVFTDTKKMGPKSDADIRLMELEEELENRLLQFVQLNIAKIRATINEAKELYGTKTKQIKSEQILCVHPSDLAVVHEDALQSAVALFDNNRRTILEKEDKDRVDFMRTFETQYETLKLVNDQNNKMVVTELRLEYWQAMEKKCSDGTLSETELQYEHQNAMDFVLDSFRCKRNHPDCFETDEYKSNLIELIDNCFLQLKALNQSKNKAALKSAFRAYDNHMESAWDPKKECLHPGDLEKEKEEAERKAITEIRPFRVREGKIFLDKKDDDEKILAEVLEARSKEIKKNNDSANATAVSIAVDLYRTEMHYNCGFSIWWVIGLGIPFLVNMSKRITYHKESKEKALMIFYEHRRRTNTSTANDKFYTDMKSKITAIRREYFYMPEDAKCLIPQIGSG